MNGAESVEIACQTVIQANAAGPTRLAGLEPHPTDNSADLLTHVCIQCDWMQTTTLARRRNGE